MTWQMMILAVIAGYICGSIPFSKIVSAVFFHRKLPQEVKVDVPESDDIYHVTSSGAAAASMTLGARAGCTIGVFDMLKVAVPTLAFKLAYPEDSCFLLAALGGMIGHNWPVFNRLKGGRGISSVYGAMFVIDWIGALSVASGGLLLGFLIARDFIVAYLAGLWLLIPWMWFRYEDWYYLGFAIAVNLIFIIAMLPDIKQYLRFKKQGKADVNSVLATTPMGRGMLKIMGWLRVKRN